MKEIDNKIIEIITTVLIKLTKDYGILDEENENKRQKFVNAVVYNTISSILIKKWKAKNSLTMRILKVLSNL